MGVQEPVEEAFEEVPATPPGVRDLNSDDDLFSDNDKTNKLPPLPTYNSDIFKGIDPVIPYKGDFDFLGVQDDKTFWYFQTPTIKKKKESCSSCVEGVKRDLKKFEDFVQNYNNERDALRAENENLKKELEELKKILEKKENDAVNISISNKEEDGVEVLVRKKTQRFINKNGDSSKKVFPEPSLNYGIQAFSISLPKDNIRYLPTNHEGLKSDNKVRKSVAQLRREFFEKTFQSEQETFTTRNYLEIKPKENKTSFRSRLTIRIQPKPRIAEAISKLTSPNSGSKVIPEPTPITLFQRFEKSKVIWENHLKETDVLQRCY